jgi:hypothetical protein
VCNQAEWGAHFGRFLVYKQIACRDLLSNQKLFGVIVFIPSGAPLNVVPNFPLFEWGMSLKKRNEILYSFL